MSRPGRWWLAVAAGVALTTALVAVWRSADRPATGPSVLSRHSSGWLAFARWLELRGVEVHRIEAPIDGELAADVIAVGLPALRAYSEDELAALDEQVSSRGRVLLIGVSCRAPGAAERQLADRFGLYPLPDGEQPPLAPLSWWRWAGRSVELSPEGGSAHPGLRLRVPRWLTPAPEGAAVRYRDPEGRGLVFVLERGKGAVVVLPAEALANGRLDEPGSQDLLAGLADAFPGSWWFDERRHGLVAAGVQVSPPRTFDLLLLHLVVVYLLAIAALARRFGPPWREIPAAVTTNRELLLGLGRLHQRLGHHREAATALVERACRLDPGLTDLGDPETVDGPDALVALARRIADRQRPSGTKLEWRRR